MRTKTLRKITGNGAAFTLVELLVSIAIFAVILVLLLNMTSAVTRIWQSSTGRIEQFRGARNGFEAMVRRLSQATLNTYWDYDNPSAPTSYLRQSELRFISGGPNPKAAPPIPALAGNASSHAVFFQAPLGNSSTANGLGELNMLLNTCGYYVDFGTDKSYRPPFLPTAVKEKYRFRLIEMIEPAERLAIYNYTSGKGKYPTLISGTQKTDSNTTIYVSATTASPIFPQPPGPPTGFTGKEWFTEPLNYSDPAITGSRPYSRVLAQNIIALVLLPKLSEQEDTTRAKLAPTYSYDSSAVNTDPAINPKNQMPPVVRATMVALDETSANRIQKGTAMPGLAELGVDLTTLFQKVKKSAGSTTDDQYAEDLAKLETALQSKRLQYRVFTTEVGITGAKWSRESTK